MINKNFSIVTVLKPGVGTRSCQVYVKGKNYYLIMPVA